MFRKLLLSITFSLLLILPTIAKQNRGLQDKLQRADSLYHNYQDNQALSIYQDVLQQDSSVYVAVWRSSFLYARIGNRFDSKEKKKQYFKKSEKLAHKALQMKPDDAESNFVMAVAMGRMALISGPKDRVAASREIKKYAEKAARLDPQHSGAWHVLGRWNLEVANLNFAERMAANLLFGGIPEASNEKAVQYLQKAVSLRPDFILYRYDLARAYEKVGKEEKARDILVKALTLKPKTEDDPETLKKCQKMLDRLQ